MQQEDNRESAFCRSTVSHLKMVNDKCLDREPNRLVISFLKTSSTRNETVVANKNAIHLSLDTRKKDCVIKRGAP